MASNDADSIEGLALITTELLLSIAGKNPSLFTVAVSNHIELLDAAARTRNAAEVCRIAIEAWDTALSAGVDRSRFEHQVIALSARKPTGDRSIRSGILIASGVLVFTAAAIAVMGYLDRGRA